MHVCIRTYTITPPAAIADASWHSSAFGVLHQPERLPAAQLYAAAQVCRVNPGEKGKYIKIILALLQSVSTAVVYECAVTLVSLSQAPTAIRAAANCYCQLLVSQSDNNVKLIVLDRLQVLLHGLVLDLLPMFCPA